MQLLPKYEFFVSEYKMKIIYDIIQHCLFNYLNDKDKIRFIRTHKNKYIIKEYNDEYKLDKVPTSFHTKLTNIKTNSVNNLPIKLTSLRIDSLKFNQSLNRLPLTLTTLNLYCANFDQELNTLPLSLTSLYIYSFTFNKSIINISNSLLTLQLYVCNSFNQSIDNLPNTLTTLEIMYCSRFTYPIYYLPQTLKTLKLKYDHSDNIYNTIYYIPPTLTHLDINNYLIGIIELPKSLTYASVNYKLIIDTINPIISNNV